MLPLAITAVWIPCYDADARLQGVETRHQHSANSVTAWSLTVPRVLTGWLPPRKDAQRMMAAIKDGRVAEVEGELRKLDQEINGRTG